MERVRGTNNWKLTVRREGDGVVIARAVTCDREAALPETVFSLPVTALDSRALSPHAGEAAGERVRIVCGREGDWDNAALHTLSLPWTLCRIGDYALYNCRALQRLRLHDSVTRWGNGVLLNCRELDSVEILREGPDRGALN